ncbi:unnamed protein product, partial [Amoebophrya sp. A25]
LRVESRHAITQRACHPDACGGLELLCSRTNLSVVSGAYRRSSIAARAADKDARVAAGIPFQDQRKKREVDLKRSTKYASIA